MQSLKAQLNDIDLQCIRALRAIQAGVGTEADSAKLVSLEQQAMDLREQISEL